MKSNFTLALFCWGLGLICTHAHAQVGIPTNNPNKDAVLDLNRTDGTSAKGLLLPRVALTGINNPAPLTANVAGMHVWNTATDGAGENAVTPGEYFNDGSKWVRVSSLTDAWIQDGNSNGAVKAIGTNDNFDLPFVTNNAEKMRLNTKGYLGIGTSPLSKIHIFNNNFSDADDDIRVQTNSDVYTPALLLARNRSNGNALVNDDIIGGVFFSTYFSSTYGQLCGMEGVYKGNGTNNLSALRFSTSNINRVIINENGDVGIGTFTPSQRLHVAGNILASGTITPSDARFKTNIKTVQKPLEIVAQLRGTSYLMDTKKFPDKGFAEGKQYGVIAQEIEKVLPELVLTGEDGYKSVNYQGLIPILIEAIKEQQKEIEQLKRK